MTHHYFLCMSNRLPFFFISLIIVVVERAYVTCPFLPLAGQFVIGVFFRPPLFSSSLSMVLAHALTSYRCYFATARIHFFVHGERIVVRPVFAPPLRFFPPFVLNISPGFFGSASSRLLEILPLRFQAFFCSAVSPQFSCPFLRFRTESLKGRTFPL